MVFIQALSYPRPLEFWHMTYIEDYVTTLMLTSHCASILEQMVT
jgi:hypothetical protein